MEVPEMGVPPVIIHFRLGFSLVNHPAIGVPPFLDPPRWIWQVSYLFVSVLERWDSQLLVIVGLEYWVYPQGWQSWLERRRSRSNTELIIFRTKLVGRDPKRQPSRVRFPRRNLVLDILDVWCLWPNSVRICIHIIIYIYIYTCILYICIYVCT